MSTPASNDYQRIWFSTSQENWQSLALIPADTGVDVLRVAEALVAIGRLHGERPIHLLNATHLPLESLHHSIESIGEMTARGERVIVAVDPVGEHPGSVAIVRATSAAVLLVRLGESVLASARTTVDVIGRERFLGSVVLDRTAGGERSTVAPMHPTVRTAEESGAAASPGARLVRIAPLALAAVVIAGAVILGPSAYRQLRSAVASPAPTGQPAVIPETAAAAPQPARVTSSPISDLQVPASSLPIADSYLLVAASFKSEKLAASLSTSLVKQGLPAFIRQQDGWSMVVIGPYLTREEAGEIQGRLEPAGFGDAHVVRERAAALATEPR